MIRGTPGAVDALVFADLLALGNATDTATAIHERIAREWSWVTLSQVKRSLARMRKEDRVTLFGVFGSTSWGLMREQRAGKIAPCEGS